MSVTASTSSMALILLRFVLCLYNSPSRPGQKRMVTAIFVIFLLISVAPAVFESTLPPPGKSSRSEGREWFSALVFGAHALFVNPVVTALAVAALLPQARETLSRPDRGALSLTSLAVQAVVFALVAISWLFRLTIPASYWHHKPFGWYQLVGWAPVDNIIFAIVQAIVLWIAIRRGRERNQLALSGESSPLLSS